MVNMTEDIFNIEVSLELKDRALASAAEGITISDVSKPDNPLIYANKGFEILTGYSAKTVVGRNCRFLQGPLTNPQTIEQIRQAIKAEKPCTVEILNYRKDGSTFWNRLSITPVRDISGKTSNFIGVQSDITARREAEEALKGANKKMKEDLNAAAEVQKALLPQVLPEIANIKFAWRYKPCEQLAGDILNIFKLDETHIAVYIIDVSGHGVSASLMAVMVSKLLSINENTKSKKRAIPSPKVVAERLNSYFQMGGDSSKFFTMVYGVLDIENYTFDYVCAGHPPPILLSAQKEPVFLYDEQFPIGVVDKPRYSQKTIKLNAGDKLVLYTDGVIEACNDKDEVFGNDRLIKQLVLLSESKLGRIFSAVIENLEQWCGKEKIRDDISMLGFQRLDD